MRDTFFPSGKRFPTEKHQISPLHISKIGSNLDAFSYISLNSTVRTRPLQSTPLEEVPAHR